MKTLILALARSGSSALYHLIHDNLPNDKQGFFEPRDKNDWESIIDSLNSFKYYTVKSIIRPYLGTKTNYIEYFNKNIILVRDPRDNLVSRLLFRLISSNFQKNFDQCVHIYRLIEKKVESPSSISLVTIFKCMEETGLMENFIEDRVQENLDLLLGIYKKNQSSFVFKYENIIDKKLSTLSEYLDIELNPIIKEIPRIKREGKKGNWKNWFTDEDVDYFMPRMGHFIDFFGYSNNWEISADPKIEKMYSLNYIENNFARKLF